MSPDRIGVGTVEVSCEVEKMAEASCEVEKTAKASREAARARRAEVG